MKKLYDLARGTVRLEVTGAQPERLLNFCAENGIEFWDTSPCDDFAISMTIHASDYPKLSGQNGKNGCEVKLIASRGGKNISRAIKRRWIFCIFCGLCITLLSLSSMFLWSIDIEGNENISDGEIMRALSECGVEYGAFWPALSSEEVRSSILMKMPDIAWMSLNVSNSRAVVVVHERIEKPEIINEKEPCDIIAEKSGIITKLSVLEGKQLVYAGDTVVKGDILVSALMDSETGDDRYVRAMAIVEADTWYEISAQTPLYEERKVEKTGKDSDFSVVIGKKRINFYSDSRNNSISCDKINKLRYISLGKAFVLPIGFASQRTAEYETETTQIDVNEAAERLKSTLIKELERRTDGGEIISVNFSVSQDEALLTVTLRAQCRENIAKEAAYD